MQDMQALGQRARKAASVIANASSGQKNQALIAMANAIETNRARLQEENQKDLAAGQEKGLDSALLDRLNLSDKTIDTMIEGLHQVANLPDPVGEITDMSYRPSGIQVGKMRMPLGVIGIIYESRPNVTVEAASLCLKSGNAAVLRGGSEAFHSNQAIAACVREGLKAAGLAEHCVQVLESTDRALVGEMIAMPEYIDVIIPRGGKGLIERISKEASVPVIKHLDGNCHTYIDKDAADDKALSIAVNAKTQRYGTCNTTESLLIHAEKAQALLPCLASAYAEKGVELRGCEKTQAIIECVAAAESDWGEEYLAPVLAVKVVESLDEAITHINQYSSQHTEAIITENYSSSRLFLRAVDSSSVMVNASTRFADGFEYGLGAEIGISTDKIHARGPVGLEGLTNQKYIVLGEGQIRE